MRMRFVSDDSAVGRSMLSLMLAFVLALVPMACGSDDDDLAVANDLIERWMVGWNTDDPDAIAAVFTEDGVLISEGVHEASWTGREEIRSEAAATISAFGEMESAGPVTMADDGTFRCTIKFRAGTHDMVAENEFEIDNDLIARLVGHDEFRDAD